MTSEHVLDCRAIRNCLLMVHQIVWQAIDRVAVVTQTDWLSCSKQLFGKVHETRQFGRFSMQQAGPSSRLQDIRDAIRVAFLLCLQVCEGSCFAQVCQESCFTNRYDGQGRCIEQ